jgi:hypothetical protein
MGQLVTLQRGAQFAAPAGFQAARGSDPARQGRRQQGQQGQRLGVGVGRGGPWFQLGKAAQHGARGGAVQVDSS